MLVFSTAAAAASSLSSSPPPPPPSSSFSVCVPEGEYQRSVPSAVGSRFDITRMYSRGKKLETLAITCVPPVGKGDCDDLKWRFGICPIEWKKPKCARPASTAAAFISFCWRDPLTSPPARCCIGRHSPIQTRSQRHPGSTARFTPAVAHMTPTPGTFSGPVYFLPTTGPARRSSGPQTSPRNGPGFR